MKVELDTGTMPHRHNNCQRRRETQRLQNAEAMAREAERVARAAAESAREASSVREKMEEVKTEAGKVEQKMMQAEAALALAVTVKEALGFPFQA